MYFKNVYNYDDSRYGCVNLSACSRLSARLLKDIVETLTGDAAPLSRLLSPSGNGPLMCV